MPKQDQKRMLTGWCESQDENRPDPAIPASIFRYVARKWRSISLAGPPARNGKAAGHAKGPDVSARPSVGLWDYTGQKVRVQPTVASIWYISISAVPPPKLAGTGPVTLLLGEYMIPKLIALSELTCQPRPAV